VQHKPLVITAAVAVVIAALGVVLLHLDDTDANDSARPVNDLRSLVSTAQGAFTSDVGQTGADYRISVTLRAPAKTIARMRSVPESAVCASATPTEVVLGPHESASVSVRVSDGAGSSCASHDARLRWTIELPSPSDGRDEALFVRRLGHAPQLVCERSFGRLACETHSDDRLIVTASPL
jgi:hypothetical protein